MLLSRGVNIVKSAGLLTQAKNIAVTGNQIRHEWSYRSAPKPNRNYVMLSEIMGGIMWWVVLWRLYHEFEHITGEYEYPDPSKWTDEELGIPPWN